MGSSLAEPPEGGTGGRGRLATVAREWGRLGAIGFGGPPTHILLLRQLCVERRRWIPGDEFEDAIAACNLLPGPASTQLAIYCAGRVAGWPGALAGGAGFILPGLAAILALAWLFLSSSRRSWASWPWWPGRACLGNSQPWRSAGGRAC